jgi:hypothetical protein
MPDDEWEDEDYEESFKEDIKDELAIDVCFLFEESWDRAPSQEEEELLSNFIYHIASDMFPDVTDYFINESLARHTLKFPYIKYSKRELAELKFMSHFYNYIFEDLMDKESRERCLDFAITHLKQAYRCFNKMDDDNIKERIEIYEDIITQWYIGNYPEIPINPVRVDRLPEKEQERIKHKTLEMIAITHVAMVKGDVDAVKNHLTSLNRIFGRYIY